MKQLNLTSEINSLVVGSTFLGTGGGGDPKESLEMYKIMVKNNKLPKLVAIDQFKESDLFVTAFAVGSISAKSDPSKPIQKAFKVLSKQLNGQIKAIIPVEIGPKSVAMAFYLASILDLPVLDADIVGGRSTPEVFLETITLFNIPRTPLVVANDKLETSTLINSVSFEKEEQFLRSFAAKSGNLAYVVGYPMSKQIIEKSIETETISEAITIGESLSDNKLNSLKKNFKTKKLFEGKIEKIITEDDKGFSKKWLTISNGKNQAKIFIKNENLILWIDDKVALTCPDLIILLDQKNQPIYNLNLINGLKVKVIGMKSRNLWRSKDGLKLFSPKVFGFGFETVLLKT